MADKIGIKRCCLLKRDRLICSSQTRVYNEVMQKYFNNINAGTHVNVCIIQ